MLKKFGNSFLSFFKTIFGCAGLSAFLVACQPAPVQTDADGTVHQQGPTFKQNESVGIKGSASDTNGKQSNSGNSSVGVNGADRGQGAADGFRGSNGADGFRGANGADGFRGANGADKFRGANGADEFRSANGADEFRGANWGSSAENLPGEAAPPDAITPFVIRFPAGFRSFTNRTYLAQTYIFIGAERQDRTHPSFMVSLIPKQPQQAEQDSIEDCLKSAIDATAKLKNEFSATPVEKGVISGVGFVRQYWKGKDPGQKTDNAGVFLVGRKGDKLIMLSSQDRMPYSQESLRQAENALHSIQLK